MKLYWTEWTKVIVLTNEQEKAYLNRIWKKVHYTFLPNWLLSDFTTFLLNQKGNFTIWHIDLKSFFDWMIKDFWIWDVDQEDFWKNTISFWTYLYSNVFINPGVDINDYKKTWDIFIQNYLASFGINIDINNISVNDIYIIFNLVLDQKNILDLKEKDFLETIIKYFSILLLITYSNKVDQLKNNTLYFTTLMTSLLNFFSELESFCDKNDIDFLILKRKFAKLNKNNKVLKIFFESYLNHSFLKEKVDWIEFLLLDFILENPKLFLHKEKIPYKKLFDKLYSIQCNIELLDKIINSFKTRDLKNLSEDVLLSIVDFIIKENQILINWDFELFVKYINFWFSSEEIERCWMECLRKIDKHRNPDKKMLLRWLLSNPDFLEILEKREIIDELKKEIMYLFEQWEWKDELEEILEGFEDYSLDELKVEILSIKTRYNLDEKIDFRKKLFWDEDFIEQKSVALEILERNFKDLINYKEIINFIFSYDIKVVEFIVFLSLKVDFLNNISKKDFEILINKLYPKELYIRTLLNWEKINIKELCWMLDIEKVRNDLVLKIKSIFKEELSKELIDKLWLQFDNFNIKRIQLLINIWKRLSENFKEELVILYLSELSNEKLEYLEILFGLFKFANISIEGYSEDFWDFLKISREKINRLKELITKDVIDKVWLLVWELEKVVFPFLKWWYEEDLINFINQINWNDLDIVPENKIDAKILEIYRKWTEEEKENLVRKITDFLNWIINNFHPDNTSSTNHSWFWRWSWNYTRKILNYIIRRLLKNENESIYEYLDRIFKLNFQKVIWLINEKNSDLKQLKNLLKACLWFDWNYLLIDLLVKIAYIILNLSNTEDNIDLKSLSQYYQEVLNQELEKLKRSLGI